MRNVEIKYDIDEQVSVMDANKPRKTSVKQVYYSMTRKDDHSPVEELVSYVLGHNNSQYRQRSNG